MQTIRFGTDGWRAVIGQDFTFENVARVTLAYTEYLKETGRNTIGVAVAYDTRFMSDRFARLIAEIMASNQIPVHLSRTFTPTPVLSYAVKSRNLATGIMVTASHNPYYYNGLKFKDSFGGPVLQDSIGNLTRYMTKSKVYIDSNNIRKYLYEEDFLVPYYAQIRKYVQLDLIKRISRERLVYNPMYGAGMGILDHLLAESAVPVYCINNHQNPLFPGGPPEPILKNLQDLKQCVIDQKAFLGLATDGDADRFGLISPAGHFVQLHDLMPLLFRYLIETRKYSGAAVRTTSMADTIDQMAKQYNRKVFEVPVGFRHVTEQMLVEDVLIGGEESGGFGYKDHLPERDGILSCLLVLEMLASYQKNMDELVAGLRLEFGPFSYGRIDEYHDSVQLLKNLKQILEDPPDSIAGIPVKSVNHLDGIKFYLDEGSWLLIRVSDTEPLARIYAGSNSDETVNKVLHAGKKLILG